MLKLNLPSFDYLVKNKKEGLHIYDTIRKKYVLLTPEEWVRQHFINFLTSYLHVPTTMIGVETSLRYNKLMKRADILVYSPSGRPVMLIECKAPPVILGSDTLLQLSIYNKDLNIPVLTITNGMEHFYWKWDSMNEKYDLIADALTYSVMKEL